MVGEVHDGHDFARAAVEGGASALLVQRELDVEVPQLVVPDVRVSMGPAAAAIWHNPGDDLTVIGVTGTNGKTTVVSILGHVLREAGRTVEVIGTLTGARTTPEATELQARLAELRDAGVTHVAMEVSSHALELHRVDAVYFDVCVFTNLGEDHLDFHGTVERYFAAKAALFEPIRCATAVLNVDDVRGRLLRDAAEVPVIEYSVDSLSDLVLGPLGSTFTWHGQRVELSLPGRHNAANALAAAEAASALGVEPGEIATALGAIPPIPGRFELLASDRGPTVVVDFAHTPDALAASLVAASELRGPEGSLTVVFGCGGDRDPVKRPHMGRVATEGSTRAIVTSDNPRSEDPLRIIDAIRTGCVREPLMEPDRRAAITLAVMDAGQSDVVLIAGKGHETGQAFADHVDPFDDRLVAAEALAQWEADR